MAGGLGRSNPGEDCQRWITRRVGGAIPVQIEQFYIYIYVCRIWHTYIYRYGSYVMVSLYAMPNYCGDKVFVGWALYERAICLICLKVRDMVRG